MALLAVEVIVAVVVVGAAVHLKQQKKYTTFKKKRPGMLDWKKVSFPEAITV